jgi:hypothetical protein
MLKEILEKIHYFGKMFFVDKQKVKFEGVKEAMVYTNYSKYTVEGYTQLTCRNLTKICRKIIYMIPALGNICQIMTKHLHMSICCRNA